MMKRREFLASIVLASPAAQLQDAIDIEVMEVFSPLSGPSALLVHHADEATREKFADWLRSNSGNAVVYKRTNGTSLDGRIFRVSLCFGRGLILSNSPTREVRARDVLRITLKR